MTSRRVSVSRGKIGRKPTDESPVDVRELGAGGRGVELVPAAPPRGFRVSGPGRLERGYRQRVGELEREVDRRANALSILRHELQVSRGVDPK